MVRNGNELLESRNINSDTSWIHDARSDTCNASVTDHSFNNNNDSYIEPVPHSARSQTTRNETFCKWDDLMFALHYRRQQKPNRRRGSSAASKQSRQQTLNMNAMVKKADDGHPTVIDVPRRTASAPSSINTDMSVASMWKEIAATRRRLERPPGSDNSALALVEGLNGTPDESNKPTGMRMFLI